MCFLSWLSKIANFQKKNQLTGDFAVGRERSFYRGLEWNAQRIFNWSSPLAFRVLLAPIWNPLRWIIICRDSLSFWDSLLCCNSNAQSQQNHPRTACPSHWWPARCLQAVGLAACRSPRARSRAAAFGSGKPLLSAQCRRLPAGRLRQRRELPASG